jgi:hypothetical protein
MYYPHRLSALYAYAHGGDVLYKEGTGRHASGVRRVRVSNFKRCSNPDPHARAALPRRKRAPPKCAYKSTRSEEFKSKHCDNEKGNRDSTTKDMNRPATEHRKMIHKIIQILHDVRSCSLVVALGPQHVCSVLSQSGRRMSAAGIP